MKSMESMNTSKQSVFPEVGVPFLWPLEVFSELAKSEASLLARQAKFQTEIEKTQIERPDPQWATPNRVVTELRTSRLRSFDEGGQSASTGTAALVLAPYAGHTSNDCRFCTGPESGRGARQARRSPRARHRLEKRDQRHARLRYR